MSKIRVCIEDSAVGISNKIKRQSNLNENLSRFNKPFQFNFVAGILQIELLSSQIVRVKNLSHHECRETNTDLDLPFGRRRFIANSFWYNLFACTTEEKTILNY